MKYAEKLVDMHVHSDNSKDACHSVTLICEKAAEFGLSGIAITDHCECRNFKEDKYEINCFQSVFETKKAKRIFEGQLLVVSGVEIGSPLRDLQAAEKILNLGQDFVLAAVHTINGKKKSFYHLDYKREDNKPELLLPRYFNDVLEVVNWNKFDSLAHLTYPLRYFPPELLANFDYKIIENQVEEILKTLAENGKALEINTCTEEAVSQIPTNNIPSMLCLLKKFKQYGGKYVTVGSDSHSAHTVGNKLTEAYDTVAEAGFDSVCIYQNRMPVQIKITD